MILLRRLFVSADVAFHLISVAIIEHVAARICREAGGPTFVRDMDTDADWSGLPLHGSAQLAVAPFWCALHADEPRRGAASQDGVALRAATRKKIAT